MTPAEVAKALSDAITPLGKEARVYTSISGGAHNGDGMIYMSAEAGWQATADKLKGHYYHDYESLLVVLNQWISEAPLRNRVVTAADLGIAS